MFTCNTPQPASLSGCIESFGFTDAAVISCLRRYKDYQLFYTAFTRLAVVFLFMLVDLQQRD
jgi:hypothetical protein